jgi:hypothetical protein
MTTGTGTTVVRVAAAAGSGRLTMRDRTMPVAKATQRKPSTTLITRSRCDISFVPLAGGRSPAMTSVSQALPRLPTVTTVVFMP